MRAALQKISEIRDSIIGLQKFNWSEHAHPLVAALDAAGFTGTPYEIAHKNTGTLLEQINTAEAEITHLKAQLSEQFDSEVNTGHAKFLLEKEVVRLAGMLRANIASGDTVLESLADSLLALVATEPLVAVARDAVVEPPKDHGIWVRGPRANTGPYWWWPAGGRYEGTEEEAKRVALGATWADRQGRIYEARKFDGTERATS